MHALLAFILVFGTIVVFHELGHFLVAKLMGIWVREFSVGFGPVLARTRRGETQYSLRLLPLGGFVRLAGMDNSPIEGGGGDGAEVPGEVELAPDDPRRFGNRPLWRRAATIAAGPLMNFVLAGVLFAVLFVPPRVVGVEPGSPAEAAGMAAGDRLVQINGMATPTMTRVLRAIYTTPPGQELAITVARDGRQHTMRVPVRLDTRRGVPYIGVRLGGIRPGLESLRAGPAFWVEALYGGFVEMVDSVGEMVRAVGRMLLRREAVSLAGPAGIFGMVAEAAGRGWLSVVGLAAVLNVNLGLINLLPVPMLDGGWLAFLGLEWIRRRPLEPRFQGVAQFLGLMLLLLLMLLATYFDIRRLT